MLKPKKKIQEGKNEIHVFAHGHESQRHVVREIQALKLRLDLVLNARAHRAQLVKEHDRTWARDIGFDLEENGPYGDGIDPGTFNALITGGFYAETRSNDLLSEVPPDSLIGWKRRTYDPVSAEQAAEIASKLRTGVIVDYDGTGTVFEPLEMVILGEGTVALWHAVSNYELMIKQMPAIEGLSPEMIEAERARLAVAKNALRKVNRLRAKQTRS